MSVMVSSSRSLCDVLEPENSDSITLYILLASITMLFELGNLSCAYALTNYLRFEATFF